MLAGRHRVVGKVGWVDDRGLEQRDLAARWSLQLADEVLELRHDAVVDALRPRWAGVGHGDLEDDGLWYDRCLDLLGEHGCRHVELQLVDHPLGELEPADHVGVGGDPLLGEEAALVSVARVVWRGGDENASGGGVLRRDLRGDDRSDRDGGQHRTQDEQPAASCNTQVVT